MTKSLFEFFPAKPSSLSPRPSRSTTTTVGKRTRTCPSVVVDENFAPIPKKAKSNHGHHHTVVAEDSQPPSSKETTIVPSNDNQATIIIMPRSRRHSSKEKNEQQKRCILTKSLETNETNPMETSMKTMTTLLEYEMCVDNDQGDHHQQQQQQHVVVVTKKAMRSSTNSKNKTPSCRHGRSRMGSKSKCSDDDDDSSWEDRSNEMLISSSSCTNRTGDGPKKANVAVVGTKHDSGTYPIGTQVRKYFKGHGWFRGTAVSYNDPYYWIRYDDGDEEEMSKEELVSLLDTTHKSQRKQCVMTQVSPIKITTRSTNKKKTAPISCHETKRYPRRKLVQMLEDDDDDDDEEEMYHLDDDKVSESSDQRDKEKIVEEMHHVVVKVDKSKQDTASHPPTSQGWGFLNSQGIQPVKTTHKPRGALTKTNNHRAHQNKHKKKTKSLHSIQKGTRTTTLSSSTTSSSTSSSIRKIIKNPYTAGDDLPIISHPQDMFDDMVHNKLTQNGNNVDILMPLLRTLKHRPLRVATMCSGTESPILALDMLTHSMDDLAKTNDQLRTFLQKEEILVDDSDGGGGGSHHHSVLPIEHVFSCEIEPFKQAYIERNFHPPILFRDIRELGNDEAYTAYGGLVPVPNREGDVDLLVAGTSCVDYSNLNNQQKTIDQKGESGQTFHGMLNWIMKAKPPLVIIENVSGAPWERKVKLFDECGYSASFVRLDTKEMYIPQTRQRGYLFAVKKSKSVKVDTTKVVEQWKEQLAKLKRPASAALDAFMLPNDDPRVIHGRSRLMANSETYGDNSGVSASSKGDRVGRVDWTKCETRHQAARSNEELGDKRPLTGWSDSSSTVMPCFGGNWNDWVNQQVHRIHDLMDINTLRMAQEGMDCTYKTMVWNLSQNVDRDTMGKLGLCQCLTPTGVPYVTNRGGPLVGEELLLLQGIPAEDLLLTKESEDDLKDLAGNAMSTTVVGACMLSALIVGCSSLTPRREISSAAECIGSLVPRPLLPETEVLITNEFGKYEERDLDVRRASQHTYKTFESLLEDADASARKCANEGSEESVPYESLMICTSCQHTLSAACAFPLRKYEEHNFEKMKTEGRSRLQPSTFRKSLLALLPMQVGFEGIHENLVDMPNEADAELWNSWVESLVDCVSDCDSGKRASKVFRFNNLKRSHLWTAEYSSTAGGKLELRIDLTGATWYLFAKGPSRRGPLKAVLDRPLAKMCVCSQTEPSLLKGKWELCLPVSTPVKVAIKGNGEMVDSWRSKLGLRGLFAEEKRFEALDISVLGMNERLRDTVSGVYTLLPKCGTACGSLYKRVGSGENMYFFLESGRCTMPNNDIYVFSKTKHRTSYGEYRDVVLETESSSTFRLTFDCRDVVSDWMVSAVTPGCWLHVEGVSLVNFMERDNGCAMVINAPTPDCELNVAMNALSWMKCPQVLSCEVPLTARDSIYIQCRANESRELNLNKSSKIFQDVAFVISQLSIPEVFVRTDDERWLLLDSSSCPRVDDEEVPCKKCAPDKPNINWSLVTKSNTRRYVPIEDGRGAAAYETALKNRPSPWIIRFKGSGLNKLTLTIGCNAVSLVQRSLGRLPLRSAARRMLIDSRRGKTDSPFTSLCDWRIVPHEDKSIARFPKLCFKSNKGDPEASQPPNFSKYKLRKEQLRSLHWMLSQEASSEPFWEEEVAEAILPNLRWRAEGRVRRPVLVRGGIIADEVGYGKTAITLGLIDASTTVNGPPPTPPENCRNYCLNTKATLIIVPSHLMGQWPQEIKKFLGSSKNVCVLENMNSFNKLTVKDVEEADIVVANFTFLCNENYYQRLLWLGSVDPESLPSGSKGGRHFDAVYDECLKNLQHVGFQLQTDCSQAFGIIEKKARDIQSRKAGATETVQLDGKKIVYKSETKSKASSAIEITKQSLAFDDFWSLSTPHVRKCVKNMKCPPLELFFWNRVVVDEFTYLSKHERLRVLNLVRHLRSSFRWCLSGTPPHATFDDIQSLAGLLQVHLGIDDVIPGIKSLGRGKRTDSERTGLENLSSFLEIRSLQWHERRHSLAQTFLDRFVRQNIAEIDEIPFDEIKNLINLTSVERAVYTELDTHLRSLEMNNKKALKSRTATRGDRETRMQQALEGSGCAEEALLKRCAHFDSSSLDEVRGKRERDKRSCEQELVDSLAAALRQRNRILKLQHDWAGNKLGEKGEVQDQLEIYFTAVDKNESVSGGADDDVHTTIKRQVEYARKMAALNPDLIDPEFAEVNSEMAVEQESKGKRGKQPIATITDRSNEEGTSHDRLYEMKFALRNHMHKVRQLGKELCARIRSKRFLESLILFRDDFKSVQCNGGGFGSCLSGVSSFGLTQIGSFTLCGHVGCIKCLQKHAESNECIEQSCKAQVQHVHIVPAVDFVEVYQMRPTSRFGSKLTAIVDRVQRIVAQGDRVIVFVQFDDLKQKVADALSERGVQSLQVKGSVGAQVKALSVLQKEKPDKGDPKVILLKMDDETSAGVNLTTCNHAIFVHPLLAATQLEYEAYETQAIGRIRRYGQTKKVHVWRFLVRNTIDTDIFVERTGQAIE